MLSKRCQNAVHILKPQYRQGFPRIRELFELEIRSLISHHTPLQIAVFHPENPVVFQNPGGVRLFCSHGVAKKEEVKSERITCTQDDILNLMLQADKQARIDVSEKWPTLDRFFYDPNKAFQAKAMSTS